MGVEKEDFDVIIVGYGIAGISAAIEAADAGKKVLALDRAYGGGASGISGGVVYGGGGTRQQEEAGYKDSAENMYNYLRQEADGIVSDDTVRRFAETSKENIEWLEKQGAEFKGTLSTYKTSYPNDPHYLYFSGNEKTWPYNESAEPAPRGHRQVAKGMDSGKVLINRMMKSAEEKGVVFRPLSRVDELIKEGNRVVGVKYRHMSPEDNKEHEKLTKRGSKLNNWAPPIGKLLTTRASNIWEKHAGPKEAYADGIILAAGGFIYNEEMKSQYAEGAYSDIIPLGTAGDDGKGIALGQSAGGQTAYMSNMTAWRFMSPMSNWLEGISVGLSGRRIANEDLYGATHSRHLIKEHDGKGFLVMDSDTWEKAIDRIPVECQPFQKLQIRFLLSPIGHKKAKTLEKLAEKTGIDYKGLKETIDGYNAGISSGKGDPGKKALDMSSEIKQGPFYAIDISIKNKFAFPTPGLTLGGLTVNEATGEVLDGENKEIKGLYAAGRNAVGICSNSYISGLSLADGVFSGRRAAKHIVNATVGENIA